MYSSLTIHKINQASLCYTDCGTPIYMSPEIIKNHAYNNKVDMWSLGIITYILLCGYPPFYHENTVYMHESPRINPQKQLFDMIQEGKIIFHNQWWRHISDDCKDFIRQLLKVNPSERMSAKQVFLSIFTIRRRHFIIHGQPN